MTRVPTSLSRRDHVYTRSDSPWIVSVSDSAYERMINYISGGGMRTFGRTVRQEEVRGRRVRFLTVFAVLSVVWLLFWFL